VQQTHGPQAARASRQTSPLSPVHPQREQAVKNTEAGLAITC